MKGKRKLGGADRSDGGDGILLGYLEGRNISFEYRWVEGKLREFPELADELVRLKADVIVTLAPPATQAAKNATRTVPRKSPRQEPEPRPAVTENGRYVLCPLGANIPDWWVRSWRPRLRPSWGEASVNRPASREVGYGEFDPIA